TQGLFGAGHPHPRLRPERYGGDRGLQRAKRGGRGLSVSQGPGVFCGVAVRQKAVPDPRALDGADPGVIGLLSRPTPDASPIGTPPRDLAQPDRAADISTDPALDIPTLRGHQSCDLFGARTRRNAHSGPHRSQEKNSPALRAKCMPDISNFSWVGVAQCRLKGDIYTYFCSTLYERACPCELSQCAFPMTPCPP